MSFESPFKGDDDIDRLVKNQSKQPQITPIPVWYRGYRFRSTLEGRWAVFLDHLDISYEYEPQGFRFGDGTCYLPDFWLPFVRWWAEVKPADPTAEERRKCDLTVMGTGAPILVLAGPPDFREYIGISRDAGMLTEANYSLDIHDHFKSYFKERRFWSEGDAPTEAHCSDRYRDAVHASRSVRFDKKGQQNP
jgi:hypothetical protein